MGIYNGPSIYNQGGGGGGGYHDGGQIVDGDFMKVENNAVSSYDNTSRDPINFYFEPADGEIINAVVELTTAVNSTVNVYVLRNGFYYLLGNVGGDTVTAGNDYKVNITGDSYSIEQVSSNNDIFLNIEGNLTKVVKINNLYWTDIVIYSATNYKQQTNYGRLVRYYQWNEIRSYNGFRVPTQSDINNLMSAVNNDVDRLKTNSIWVTPGTDDFGFNAYPDSYMTAAGVFPISWPLGSYFATWTSRENGELGAYYFGFNNAGSYGQMSENKEAYIPLRLCKDV